MSFVLRVEQAIHPDTVPPYRTEFDHLKLELREREAVEWYLSPDHHPDWWGDGLLDGEEPELDPPLRRVEFGQGLCPNGCIEAEFYVHREVAKWMDRSFLAEHLDLLTENEDGSFELREFFENNYVVRSILWGLADPDFQNQTAVEVNQKWAKMIVSLFEDHWD